MCQESGAGYSAYMSDLWAAGVCLWIFIFGKLPFFNADVVQLFSMIRFFLSIQLFFYYIHIFYLEMKNLLDLIEYLQVYFIYIYILYFDNINQHISYRIGRFINIFNEKRPKKTVNSFCI